MNKYRTCFLVFNRNQVKETRADCHRWGSPINFLLAYAKCCSFCLKVPVRIFLHLITVAHFFHILHFKSSRALVFHYTLINWAAFPLQSCIYHQVQQNSLYVPTDRWSESLTHVLQNLAWDVFCRVEKILEAFPVYPAASFICTVLKSVWKLRTGCFYVGISFIWLFEFLLMFCGHCGSVRKDKLPNVTEKGACIPQGFQRNRTQ